MREESEFMIDGSQAGQGRYKIILTGRGLRKAVVREESEFMIDSSQAGQGEYIRLF